MTTTNDTRVATFVVCHPVDEEQVRKMAWPRTKIITSSLMPPENSYAFATLDEAQQFVQDAEDAFTKLTDRDDEAAIRFRIAEEIREELSKKEDAGIFNLGWRCGMLQAIAIIERGTGVAGEEENDGTQ